MIVHPAYLESKEPDASRLYGLGVGRLFGKAGGKPKGTSLSGRALHPQGPTHLFHELFGNSQPQSGASELSGCGTIGLRKWLEDFGLCLRGHADTGISNLHSNSHGFLSFLYPLDMDHDLADGRKFNRIPHQIHENLTKTPGVPLQGGRHSGRDEPHEF